MPGESAELRLTILVKDDAARALARGDREELEDVLILHVEGGNDTFVSVTGEFLASCFGSSIQSLLELKTPARFAQDCTSRLPTLHLPPIPREVWRLCGAILEKGMDEDKIFFLCGDETEVCMMKPKPLDMHFGPSTHFAGLNRNFRHFSPRLGRSGPAWTREHLFAVIFNLILSLKLLYNFSGRCLSL